MQMVLFSTKLTPFKKKIIEGLFIARETIVKQTSAFLCCKTLPLGNNLKHNTSKRMLILVVTEDNRMVKNVFRTSTHFNF